MKRIDELKEKYESLYQELENDNDEVVQEVYDLEQEVEGELSFAQGEDHHELKALLKKIKSMKEEFDLYDEEAERDNMFPNRNDDDFDEDSMNFDSVFGKD